MGELLNRDNVLPLYTYRIFGEYSMFNIISKNNNNNISIGLIFYNNMIIIFLQGA